LLSRVLPRSLRRHLKRTLCGFLYLHSPDTRSLLQGNTGLCH
jgi:hypothetical protein